MVENGAGTEPHARDRVGLPKKHARGKATG